MNFDMKQTPALKAVFKNVLNELCPSAQWVRLFLGRFTTPRPKRACAVVREIAPKTALTEKVVGGS